MASLVLRGNTWHLMWRWRGRQKSKTTKVEHDGRFRDGEPIPPTAAKRELRRLETQLDQGHSFETKSLSELLDLVKKEYDVAGYASAPSLPSRIQHLRDWFGNLRADRINENDFLEYAEFRKKPDQDRGPASNGTINRELEVLMKALRMGKIHPLPILKKLPEAPPRQGFFDDAKIAAITRKLPAYLQPPVWFGYYTGWRREEVFSLEWSQVDTDAGEVRLWTSKNDEPRVFPIDAAPGLRQLIETQLARRDEWKKAGHITPFVFARFIKKKKLVRRMVDFRKAWDTACIAAGCPGMEFHDLRRSAARNLEMAGWPRSMIMRWMGHETEAMFHRYRIVSAADRDIVSRMLEERRKAAGK